MSSSQVHTETEKKKNTVGSSSSWPCFWKALWLQILQGACLAPGKAPGLVNTEPSKRVPAPAGRWCSCRNADKGKWGRYSRNGGGIKINVICCYAILYQERLLTLLEMVTLKKTMNPGECSWVGQSTSNLRVRLVSWRSGYTLGVLIARPTSEPPGAGPLQGALVPRGSI